ncbi:MAG: hypothetical protein QOJ53_513 [Sphingomonadales bacterium]|jgi:hypothetical protein|nr:hypothetical protein [Sphingomonadales bacterium]MEA3043024.1 hypothetical protein [Sphingomonadales bacterium]MEA3046181.1 hypothetical protein [Sphingomonadales bacterium]
MVATEEAVQSLAALSRKAEVIITLQAFTARSLTANPPADGESLGENIGVGDRNLDRFVRPWINKRFRVPDGKPRIPPGAITGKTTFKQLCDLAGA